MSKKIKVLYVMTHCTKSGPIQQMLNLISNLDQSRFQAYLVTIYEEDTSGLSMLEDYKKVIHHKLIPISKRDILLGRTKPMQDYISDIQPDVIHSFGVFPDYMIARMRFRNHVLTSRNYVYDDYPDQYGRILGTLLAWIHLYAIKHAKYARCCSESLHRIYKEKLEIDLPFIRNGIDVKHFYAVTDDEKASIRKQLGLPINKKIIVYGGVFNERKNQEFLLRGVSKEKLFQDYIFLLLGDGAEYSRLKNEYGKENNIFMPGNTTKMAEYLRASDYYVSTSKSEGLPNGVLEAMVSGLPVFLSDIPQHVEVLLGKKDYGMTYRQNDIEDFRKQLLVFLNLNREKMSRRAIESVTQNFSAEIMSRNYQCLYNEIQNQDC